MAAEREIHPKRDQVFRSQESPSTQNKMCILHFTLDSHRHEVLQMEEEVVVEEASFSPVLHLVGEVVAILSVYFETKEKKESTGLEEYQGKRE